MPFHVSFLVFFTSFRVFSHVFSCLFHVFSCFSSDVFSCLFHVFSCFFRCLFLSCLFHVFSCFFRCLFVSFGKDSLVSAWFHVNSYIFQDFSCLFTCLFTCLFRVFSCLSASFPVFSHFSVTSLSLSLSGCLSRSSPVYGCLSLSLSLPPLCLCVPLSVSPSLLFAKKLNALAD